ncbi:hypothetical protein ACUXST_001465 [Sphingomonas sp. F9_3S_D5_B_2]
MTGYREHSFDLNAPSPQGRPERPFNWVQWCGVAMEVAALVGYGYFVAAKVGWVRDPGFDTMSIALPFLILGQTLIFSRRRDYVDPAPELAAARKRWLIIVVAICAAILGAATIIAMKGY